MTLRSFFSKVRRKILRLLLGRELFERINQPKENISFEHDFNIINDKLNLLSEDLTKNTYQIIKNNYEAITARDINTKTFDKYRNCNKEHEIVLLATGPTLNFYEPLPGVINLGVNTTVLFSKVKLDYLFVQDYFAIEKIIDKVIEYPCKKFFLTTGSLPFCLPVWLTDLPNVEEYSCYLGPTEYRTCHYDIRKAPLGNPGRTVALSAFQFALWTYPKRIYLVGCDCNNSGHFDDIKTDFSTNNTILDGWKKLKEFQTIYYPDVEIISINPVGLKGLFKDTYTESYLAANQ